MIQSWFPTLIYNSDITIDSDSLVSQAYHIQSQYKESSDWRCGTYTSLGYNLLNDQTFSELKNVCAQHVIKFSKEYGVDDADIECSELWVNIAGQNDYQEYHTHPNNHFSCVYYAKAHEGCGNIIFKSFEADCDMFTLPSHTYKEASYKTCSYKPVVGKILIFRSNLQHMVEQNKSGEDRISIAMNFRIGNI